MREALGLSQAELCRAIGIAPNRWNQFEQGKRRITVDVARRLKKNYGVTLDYIYEGDLSGLPKRIVDELVGQAAQ